MNILMLLALGATVSLRTWAVEYSDERPIQEGVFGTVVEFRHPTIKGLKFNCLERQVLSQGLLPGTEVEAYNASRALQGAIEARASQRLAQDVAAERDVVCARTQTVIAAMNATLGGLKSFTSAASDVYYRAGGALAYNRSYGRWAICVEGLENLEYVLAATRVCNRSELPRGRFMGFTESVEGRRRVWVTIDEAGVSISGTIGNGIFNIGPTAPKIVDDSSSSGGPLRVKVSHAELTWKDGAYTLNIYDQTVLLAPASDEPK